MFQKVTETELLHVCDILGCLCCTAIQVHSYAILRWLKKKV